MFRSVSSPFCCFFQCFLFFVLFFVFVFSFFGYLFFVVFCFFSGVRKNFRSGIYYIFGESRENFPEEKKFFPLSLLLADLIALKKDRRISHRSLKFRSNSFRKLPYLKSFWPSGSFNPLFLSEDSKDFSIAC